ncbi:MAG: hypothetical protein ACOCUI_05490 [bacterium]
MSSDNIKNKAQGIINGLENMEKSKKEENNKRVDKEKSKRSFMLTKEEIEKIYILKAKFQDKTLSELVGKAINLLYKEVNE